MIRIFLLSALLLFSTAAAADTETEIRTALDYLAQVWNEKDLEAIAGYYHSDYMLITNDGTVSRTQFLDDLAQIGRSGGDRGTVRYSGVVVKPLGEDHAVAYGKSSLSFEDGSSIDNWFTTVYLKTPFGWKALITKN